MSSKKNTPSSAFDVPSKLVPKLRFPEFEGDWLQKTIGEVSEVLMCKRIFSEETNTIQGVPFYKIGTLGGIADCFISRVKFEEYRTQYNYPRKGEVLITCSGTVGKCLQFDGKDAYFQDSNIVWLKNENGEISNEFMFISLSNVDWTRLNSTTITRIYGADLRGLIIRFPQEATEQHRIASCLSSLDELITAQTQKVEVLKTHKKGLMQQLFPREGETQPRLRFPEFEGAWETGTLGDVLLATSNGLSLPQCADNTGYKVTRIETISAGTIDMDKIGFVKSSHDITSYLLKVGDILFSNINSVAHIGKSVYVDKDYGLYHGMNLLRLIVDRQKCAPKFLFYLINTNGNRESFRERANKAVNQASINQTELGRTLLAVPSISEQQRIASCLSSLDELITNESNKLDVYKTHKKGLMQQLFPSIQEN